MPIPKSCGAVNAAAATQTAAITAAPSRSSVTWAPLGTELLQALLDVV
jgi:hypothetical protein